jgi:hypothetical protein
MIFARADFERPLAASSRCWFAISGRAPSFPKTPFIVLMAISRILSGQFLSRDDHLSLPSRNRRTRARSRVRGIAMRRYPRIKLAGCPSSVLSCTAWGFSCLANYSASGELLPRLFTLACTQRTGGIFSVTLSVIAVFQLRCPRVLRGMPPYGVRTFLQQVPPTRDSPAIICHRRISYHNG